MLLFLGLLQQQEEVEEEEQEETGRTDVGGGKGLQEVHIRQGGDWSMCEPLALLTGRFWSCGYFC